MRRGLYQHYKGKLYFVIGEGTHTETGEKFAIYKRGDLIWARPIRMFKQKVKVGRKTVPRFKFLQEV